MAIEFVRLSTRVMEDVIFGSFANKARNTTIPTRKTVTLTTHMDHQQSVNLRIFEGEASRCQVDFGAGPIGTCKTLKDCMFCISDIV